MKYILIFILFISCGKPQSILICGDKPCKNKDEANKYFNENLTLEIKIIDKKKEETFNLVNLNLNKNEIKDVRIFKKMEDNKINDIQKEFKVSKQPINNEGAKKKKPKKPAINTTEKNNVNNKKKDSSFVKLNKDRNLKKKRKTSNKKPLETKNAVNTKNICLVLENCDIDQITKFLIEKGDKKDFPDITRSE